MRKNFLAGSIVTITVVAVLLYACTHEPLINNAGGSGGGGNPTPSSTCSADSVYFVNDIMPMISSNCAMAGCHDNITHAEGVNLTTYNYIMRYVVAGSASNSKLYRMIIRTDNERMPPPPRLPMTASQKALIQKWINQGAKNNYCTGRCDTAQYTFTTAIKPLLDNKCVGCHNPSSAGGNIDLSTYSNVKTVALNGKLYGSVSQQPGYSPMPKGAAKLSDCEITQVQKWIAAGALNN